jgi:PAS domain S-box-containing protein
MSNQPTYEELELRVKELEREAVKLKKVEEELQESEQCFRTMIEKSPSAIELYEPNGKLLSVNEEWESFWSLKKSVVADFNILDDKECERTGLTAAFKKALQGIVCRIPPAKYDPKESGMSGGSIRWIDSKIYPIHYQHGKINKIVLVMEDITELKQSEEELINHRNHLEEMVKERTVELENEITERKQVERTLHDREKLLTAFTNALPDISFIFDEDGKYIEILASQERLLIAKPDEMLGKTIYETLPEEVADKIHRKIEDTIKTNKSQVLEYKLVVPAGETWFEGRSAHMKKNVDDKNSIVWLTHDISDRKQAEESLQKAHDELELKVESRTAELTKTNLALKDEISERILNEKSLQESEDTFNQFMENFPGMVFINEPGKYLIYVNNIILKKLNSTNEEVLYRDFKEIVPVEIADKIREQDSIVISKDKTLQIEEIGQDIFEHQVWLYYKFPIHRQEKSTLVGGFGIDITEQRQIQKQLIRSERLAATGQLATSIAHEINSPLQAVTVMLSSMKEEYNQNEELSGNIDLLIGAFESIRDTVKNLGDLNRPGLAEIQFINGKYSVIPCLYEIASNGLNFFDKG